MLQRNVLFFFIFFLWTAAVVASRTLEQEDNNLENYQIQQGTCFRVRIDQGNDDDGNAYFYNGAYRSQYQRYMSFAFCDNANLCTDYVTELDTFVEGAVEYIQNYCNSCQNTCENRRRLEDGKDEEEEDRDEEGEEEDNEEDEESGDEEDDNEYWNVDCSTCANECNLMNNGNAGLDESEYLECQAAEYGQDDMEYYTAPQCENGEVVIGHFYDDECTIKTSTLQDQDFSYNTFRTIQATKILCDLNEDSCMDLFDDAIYCGENYDEGENEEEAHLCKAAKAAGRTYTFYKKPFYKKVPMASIGLLAIMLSAVFSFLAYTYYVRHSRSKVPMAQLDGTNLPAMT